MLLLLTKAVPTLVRYNHPNLGRLVTPWSRVLAEVAKCDVRCANCHRVRTFEAKHGRRRQAATPPADGQGRLL